jgi:1-acyl-sn-glycerol-3-phosphate acyltransferase
MTTIHRNLAHRLYFRAYFQINRVWRIFATGLVFVLFGAGAVLISLTIFPLLRLFSPQADVARRRIQRGMRHTFHIYMEMMRVLGLMTYEVHGLERLLIPGRLIVPSHPTLIDVVAMVSLLPEVDCIVKRGLWRNPFLRWPVLWASYLPNTEGEELIQSCAARLRAGHSLLVFPEGTRTVPGKTPILQRGAAHIALAANAEILPVKITCDPPTLYKHNPWYRVPERKFHVTIAVGQAIPVSAFQRKDEPPSLSARRLTLWLRDYYQGINQNQPTELENIGSDHVESRPN